MTSNICPSCNGDGIVITDMDEETGDVLDTRDCPTCKGTGTVD